MKKRRKSKTREERIEEAVEEQFVVWQSLYKSAEDENPDNLKDFILSKQTEIRMKSGIGMIIFGAIFNFIIGKILERIWEKHYGNL